MPLRITTQSQTVFDYGNVTLWRTRRLGGATMLVAVLNDGTTRDVAICESRDEAKSVSQMIVDKARAVGERRVHVRAGDAVRLLRETAHQRRAIETRHAR